MICSSPATLHSEQFVRQERIAANSICMIVWAHLPVSL